jgi:hypothetical protein
MVIDPDELARLEEERRFLLRSLNDLEREHAVGDVDDHDYEELKDGYTARAASVLRAIEAGQEPVGDRRRSPWKILSVMACIAGFAILAGILVGRFSGTRLSTQTGSGAKADSVQAMIVDARGLLSTDTLAALKQYGEVLKVAPTNAEALAYSGWLSVQLGDSSNSTTLIDAGKDLLDRALVAAPTYPDALAFEGVVTFRYDNDAKRAVELFDRYFATPNLPPLLIGLVTQIDTEARQAVGLPARPTGPHGAPVAPSATTVAP